MVEVINIAVLPDYKIRVALSNGKTGDFDVSPYLDKGIFNELKDYEYFSRARVELGTIVWPHGQDFSPETIEMKMQEHLVKI